MLALKRQLLLLLIGAAVLTGCGFKIRGADFGLPFKTFAVQGSVGVADEVRQAVAGQPNIRVVDKPAQAQVVLIVITQQVDRTVTAFNAAGRPRELQVRMRVTYRVTDGLSVELSPAQEITQIRDLSISESEILAQADAERFLRDDMQRDIAQQLIRRLRAVKLPG